MYPLATPTEPHPASLVRSHHTRRELVKANRVLDAFRTLFSSENNSLCPVPFPQGEQPQDRRADGAPRSDLRRCRWFFFGSQGALIALAIAVAINFFMYWFSDKIAIKAARARPVAEHGLPDVYGIVELKGVPEEWAIYEVAETS